MHEAMTLIEQYARAFEDCDVWKPKQFITSQPDSFEKKILQYISQEHSEKYVEELKEMQTKNKYFWEFLEKQRPLPKFSQQSRKRKKSSTPQDQWIVMQTKQAMKKKLKNLPLN